MVCPHFYVSKKNTNKNDCIRRRDLRSGDRRPLFVGTFSHAGLYIAGNIGNPAVSMVIEYGYKSALLCYAAVAVLSLLLVPNKEVALLFCRLFLGFIPF